MKVPAIFVLAFPAFRLVRLAYHGLLPGKAIYGLLGVYGSRKPVLGVPATTLVVAVFNTVTHGFIV